MEILLILLLSLILDLAFGELPSIIHPVAWIGKTASYLEKGANNLYPIFQFVYGMGMVLIIIALFTAPVYFLLLYLESLNLIIYVVVGAILFKFTFSWKELRQSALRVKRLLISDKINEARFQLRALVGRDTQNLSQALLVSATVESVAENASDSFVAPLFYFLLFGAPGAIAYRVVNTLDAMIGYHGKYEYLGKFASRLDDVLNFIPARLTAILLVISAFLCRRHGRKSWQTTLREHNRTESPNAGWPMAAVAGALDMQLEKRGCYKLGRASASLVPKTIDDSLKLVQVAMLIWVLICFTTGGIQYAIRA